MPTGAFSSSENGADIAAGAGPIMVRGGSTLKVQTDGGPLHFQGEPVGTNSGRAADVHDGVAIGLEANGFLTGVIHSIGRCAPVPRGYHRGSDGPPERDDFNGFNCENA